MDEIFPLEQEAYLRKLIAREEARYEFARTHKAEASVLNSMSGYIEVLKEYLQLLVEKKNA